MTERTTVKQSLLDDDAISITSTVSETYDSEQEFTVHRILAEKTQSGRKIYLIRWEGYPIEKSTWEPKKNIQDDEILSLWKERKLRESKGLDEPFDISEFNALLARLAQEKAQRHRRRKAKRRRLGILVSPSESENEQVNDSDSSIEAIEENGLGEGPGVKTKSKGKGKPPLKKQPKASKPLNQQRESNASDLDATRKSQDNRALGLSSRLSPEKIQPASRQASVVRVSKIYSFIAQHAPTIYICNFNLSNKITELQTLADVVSILFRCARISKASLGANIHTRHTSRLVVLRSSFSTETCQT
jgi:chromo domain-containing protein 1